MNNVLPGFTLLSLSAAMWRLICAVLIFADVYTIHTKQANANKNYRKN